MGVLDVPGLVCGSLRYPGLTSQYISWIIPHLPLPICPMKNWQIVIGLLMFVEGNGSAEKVVGRNKAFRGSLRIHRNQLLQF